MLLVDLTSDGAGKPVLLLKKQGLVDFGQVIKNLQSSEIEYSEVHGGFIRIPLCKKDGGVIITSTEDLERKCFAGMVRYEGELPNRISNDRISEEWSRLQLQAHCFAYEGREEGFVRNKVREILENPGQTLDDDATSDVELPSPSSSAPGSPFGPGSVTPPRGSVVVAGIFGETNKKRSGSMQIVETVRSRVPTFGAASED